MGAAKIYIIIYGILMLTGAYFGHKAGSKVSVVMGLISGAVVLALAYFHSRFPVNSRVVLLITAAGLSALFLCRLVITKKFMPSGMLLCASVLAIVASYLLSTQ